MARVARHRTDIVTGLSLVVGAAAGYGILGLTIGISGMLLLVLVKELFWLRAQSRPDRTLRWLFSHAASVDEVERLMRTLREAHRDVLQAREEPRQ